MSKLMILIHDLENDEILEREMTQSEIDSYATQQELGLQIEQQLAEKAAEKAALLAKLGISEDEAKLLLS